MLRKNLPKILIIAGILCFVCPIVYELINMPWNSLLNDNVNEVVLDDPPPPVVNYVEYTSPPAEADDNSVPEESEPDKKPQASPEELPVDLPGEAVPVSARASDYVPPDAVLLGYVKIPRINISENLFEGSGEEMANGIGHVEGSAMPGQIGNSCIAAHRVSFMGTPAFRYLDRVQDGDAVIVKFDGIEYTYEVFDSFIVKKEDVWVLGQIENVPYALTMITCDPVVHPGNRPDRLIVRATLLNPPETPEETLGENVAAPIAPSALSAEEYFGVPYADPFKNSQQ